MKAQGKWIKTILAPIYFYLLTLVFQLPAYAGTVGISGQWDFVGELLTYDQTGLVVDSNSINLDGNFDFDTGSVYIKDSTPFFGLFWQSNGSLVDQLDGTYFSSHTACWSSCYDWEITWEITQTSNIATVIAIDTDSDGIPGTAMLTGPFPGFTHQINGTLTQVVPIPATLWLFASGLLALFGTHCKRKVNELARLCQ